MKRNAFAKALTRRKILKYGFYGTTATVLSPSLWLNGCSNFSFGKRPNIILVSIDTLRVNNLGCYGYKRKTSPNIDAFAAENMIFKNCFSQAPVTGPSCASFITGFLPHEVKMTENTTKLPPEAPTITEALNDDGYKTYGVVSNVFLKNHGFQQGFDIFDDTMQERESVRNIPERIAENTTRDAIDILKQHTNGSFFMWIHYQDPHGPYTPPKPYKTLFANHGQKPVHLRFNETNSGLNGIPYYQRLGKNTDYHYYVSQYDGEIRYLDEHFGRLIGYLKASGSYDDSVIILTADHGEALGEYNHFFAHGQDLSNALLHVPFIIKDSASSKGIHNEYIQLLDLAPTILNTAGIKSNLPYRGRDVLTAPATNVAIYSELNVTAASLITDGLKLILYGNFKLLFDLTKDPTEKSNLSKNPAYKERVNKMLGQLLQTCRREDLLNLKEQKPADLTEKQIENLRSLGYVD